MNNEDAVRRAGWLATLGQDLRYAGRTLRAAPAFSIAVLLAVALSIGPVAAILSVGNWLLWRPHPGVSDARSLAVVWFGRWRQTATGVSVSPSGVSADGVAGIRSRARSVTGIAGVQESSAALAVAGAAPREAGAATVSADFFEVLGVRLSAGRSFTPDDDRGPAGSPVVVVSHGLAQSAFGSAQAAVGQAVTLNSRPFTIVGVAPPSFNGITHAGGIDVWLTGATWPYLNHLARPPGEFFYAFVVRIAARRTVADVESELTALVKQLSEDRADVSARVFPGLGPPPLTRARTAAAIRTLLAIGAVLLLLGCANVANLLMFRVARRAPEIALRQVLGASRSRLMQSQMMESWLLSIAGASLGLVLAWYLKEVIERLLFPAAAGLSVTVPMDWRVLGLTALVAVATGTLAALAPGWLMARTRGLPSQGRTTTWSGAPRLRGSLGVVQLAFSLTLLVSALLLVATLRNLRAVDLGLDPRDVHVVAFNLDQHGYDSPRALAYHRAVLPSLRSTGEFEAVSVSTRAPFGSRSSVGVIPPGGEPDRPVSVAANGVSDDYFRLLSIPILRGRVFTAEDAFAPDQHGPAVVNERLAQQLFSSVDVVGRTVRLARTGAAPERALTIVGVVRDSHWRSITGEPDPFLYVPFAQFRSAGTSGVYMIKSTLPGRRVGEIATTLGARTASAIPFSAARPLSAGIDGELSEQRVFAWMLTLLAALGFALAALGLYGLVAQATVERRREFGIRLALGAAGWDIVRLVARYAAVVSTLGVVAGLALSSFATRVIRSLLFGISPLDPLAYVTAVGVLLAVVAVACIVPAMRVLRVQAVEALRAE